MESSFKELQRLFSARFKEQELLSKHTNFRIGGPAKWFVEAKTIDEIVYVLNLTREHHVPFFVLGGGSNVLVSDTGFDGLVIKLAHRTYKREGTKITADAAVLSAFLSRKAGEA